MRCYPTSTWIVRTAAWLRDRAVHVGVVLAATSCDVYNGELLMGSERGAADGNQDASQSDPASPSSPISPTMSETAVNGSATPPADTRRITPPPDGAGQSNDGDAGAADDTTRCGDGRVSGVEKCDLSIPADQPGACPTSCPALSLCAPRVLNGSACQAVCELREVSCEGGDQCCPGKCTEDNDPDCAGRCGDGIVQEAIGETCEPESKTPCPAPDTSCDDGKPCTRDALVGSADTCDVACNHEAITALDSEDGCCPEGANALDDNNCEPKCGNGVVERDEACDGSEGCDDTCKPQATLTERCAAAAATECQKCACMHCPEHEVACRMSEDQANNNACSSVLDCSQYNQCRDANACYCGESLLCVVPPFGPCKDAIDAVSGGTDVNEALAQANDPNTALGRAALSNACRIEHCFEACR